MNVLVMVTVFCCHGNHCLCRDPQLLLALLLAAASAQKYTGSEAATAGEAVEALETAGEAVEAASEAVEETGDEVDAAANEVLDEAEQARDTSAEDPPLVVAAEKTAEEGDETNGDTFKEQADVPACALNTSKPWCLSDSEYPGDRIKQAVSYHHYSVLQLYQDLVADTANSVDRLKTLEEETYLCSSSSSYVQPLRAVNTAGRWRVVVNGIKVMVG